MLCSPLLGGGYPAQTFRNFGRGGLTQNGDAKMSALTNETRERLFLSGRLIAKQTPVKNRPSSPRRKTRVAAASDGKDRYHQDALEAFHNDALTRAQLDYLQRQAAQRANAINKEVCKLNLEAVHKPSVSQKKTPCRTRRTTRSSAKSGDSNDDAEPEPERPLLSPNLYNEASLADLLIISKKSVQNIYSKSPWLLPLAISIPGARGPRWTPESVQEWLSARPKHTSKLVPVAPKKKVGRPRIAHAVKGGASC